MSIDQLPTLFQLTKVGDINLAHRVVLAPLTRLRADDSHVPTDLMVEYYSQRSSTPGTLLITEGTPISLQAAGFPNVPGVWSDAQLAGWRKVCRMLYMPASTSLFV